VSDATGAGSPQNANWGFGPIVLVLDSLAEISKFSGGIPNITTIVRNTGKPTIGLGVFKHAQLEDGSKSDKDAWLKSERKQVFRFKRWDEVLSFLEIQKMKDLTPPAIVLQAFERTSSHQSGKSPEHQAIQNWLQNNSSTVGIASNEGIVFEQQEYLFWSLDRLDLLLKTSNEWIGIEVKPSGASDDEIRKGLYQVIKYRALLDAELLAEGLPQSSSCILVTGGLFPPSLKALAERFQIRVIENVTKRMTVLGH